MNKPEVLSKATDLHERVDRLTEKEKDCLRRWMHHQTAKQIALDLGVSHHAIEKRLKTARLKLDVASSIDAAQMLAQVEGYDWTASRSPDLDRSPPINNPWPFRPVLIGAIAMSLLASVVLVALSHSGTAELDLKPGDLLLVAPVTFEQLDENKSGYLEGDEAPPLIHASGNPSYIPDEDGSAELSSEQFIITTKPTRDSFYRQADANGDGRISPGEYDAWAKPQAHRLSPES